MTNTSPLSSHRNYGIDLLRIVSMFMVVILHVVGVGGMTAAAEHLPLTHATLLFLRTLAVCAVNTYGIISGYVGWRTTFRLSNLATLWLQVFVYSAGFGVLFFLLAPETTSVKEVIKLCLPVLMERYWYFTAYFLVYLISPLLNAAIRTLSKPMLGFSLLTVLVLICLGSSTVFVTNAFGQNRGYSFVWLVILYCVGGYLGKYGLPRLKHPLLLYLLCGVVAWASRWPLTALEMAAPDRLTEYTSPLVLLMGVGLVVLFSRLSLPSWLQRVTAFMAPLSFGVYLIHLHPLVRGEILLDAFTELVHYPALTMIPIVLGLAIGIYLVCTAIEWLRHLVFKWLRIKPRLQALEERYIQPYLQKEETV